MNVVQLDLFAPKPAALKPKKAIAGSGPRACPHHNTGYVCPDCPGDMETDGWGFVHHSLLAGRIAVRVCGYCRMPVTREHWDSDTGACTEAGCLEWHARR